MRHTRLFSTAAGAVVALSLSTALAPSAASAATTVCGGNAATAIAGPDVSSYQHNNGAAITWSKIKAAGCTFAIVKATEGSGYTNPWFASDYTGAATAGLVHGAYHFARPSTSGGLQANAFAQADYFSKAVGNAATANTLPPTLDLEVTGGLTQPQLVVWAQDFLLRAWKDTGRKPMLYTGAYFYSDTLADPAAFSRYTHWIAAYGSSQPSAAQLWQYTDSASLPGITGGSDDSQYVGQTAAWTAVADGTQPSDPAAAPGAPVSVTATAGDGTATVSWVPGDAGTAPVTSWKVLNEQTGASTVVSGDTTSVSVTGLTNGKGYNFKVTGVNAVGAGASSNGTHTVTPMVPTGLAISAPATINYGRAGAVVTVTLTRDGSSPYVGQQVLVTDRVRGATGAWTTLVNGITNSQGQVTVTIHPTQAVNIQAQFTGANGAAVPQSGSALVRVRPVASFAVPPAKAATGNVVVLTGGVSPVVAGQVADLQRLVAGKWTTVTTMTIDSRGYWTVRQTLTQHKTTYTWRAYVPAAYNRADAASPTRTTTTTT